MGHPGSSLTPRRPNDAAHSRTRREAPDVLDTDHDSSIVSHAGQPQGPDKPTWINEQTKSGLRGGIVGDLRSMLGPDVSLESALDEIAKETGVLATEMVALRLFPEGLGRAPR